MKKLVFGLVVALLFTVAAVAQDVPKFEVPVGFSFVNVHPDLSPVSSFNIFGGGGGFVYNVTPWIGIKADLMGYSQGSGLKNQLVNNNIPVTFNVQGNVFTYMFGPQIKKHSGRFQPFGEALFGGAHSNAYANAYNNIHGLTSTNGSNNAFAMAFGGGLDYALTPHFQIRPVEVDYLYTRFGANGISNSQNNFRYFAGVNFTFGGK